MFDVYLYRHVVMKNNVMRHLVHYTILFITPYAKVFA